MDNNKCKMLFEFDWNEVFEGIKQGVIRELSEANFDTIVNLVIDDVKNEFRNKIRLTYSDESQIREEIKKEIKDKVWLTLVQETKNQYTDMLLNKYRERFIDNEHDMNDVKQQVIWKLKEELYESLYSEIRNSIIHDTKEKVGKSFDAVLGKLIAVGNSNKSISEDEYNDLYKSRLKLIALESCGVDNWTYYNYAMELYKNSIGE